MKKLWIIFLGWMLVSAGSAFAGLYDNGDGTVTDTATGFTWQQETSGPMTWEEALAYCDTLSLGGYSDWRLASIKELDSIVDLKVASPAINTTYFKDTEPANYWTSTTRAGSRTRAFVIDFTLGGNNTLTKTSTAYVRAVRGGTIDPGPPAPYVDNGNGTITDLRNGLMWQKDSARDQFGEPSAMNWEEALAQCENLFLGGHSDWRLPNIKELDSIVDLEVASPAINTTYFKDTEPSIYWTSTTRAGSATRAFVIDFILGGNNTLTKTSTAHVRAVRGGQIGSFGNLRVFIEPQEAIDAGAQWRRTGTGTWHSSGYEEIDVPTGQHVVEFKDIDDWLKPDNQTVTISQGTTANIIGTYTYAGQPVAGIPSFIQVPSQSTTGNYSIEWGSSSTPEVTYVLQEATNSSFTSGLITVYTGPDLSTLISGRSDGTYYYRVKATRIGYEDSQWRVGNNGCVVAVHLPSGALQVFIAPQEAIDAGAQWRRTETGTWRDSGYVEFDLPIGQHTLEFKDITGWIKPADQTVTISDGQLTTFTGTYESSWDSVYQSMFFGNLADVDILRQYRDDILRKSPKGNTYVKRLYSLSHEVAFIMLQNQEIMAQAVSVADQLVLEIDYVLQGETGYLSRPLLVEIHALLDAMHKEGGPILKHLINDVRRELKDPDILYHFLGMQKAFD